MAVPFLIHEKPNDYGPILEKWHMGNDDLARLERSTFDWDHAEVATWLCHKWGLPENLALAIGESHGTLDLGGQCPPAVMLVSCLRESEEDAGVDLLIDTALHRYNVSRDTAFHCVDDGLQQAEDFIQMMQ
jgi:HD-like signal output (HDOD) protein